MASSKVNVLNKCDNFSFSDKAVVKKILNILFKNNTIKEKSPIFKHKFKKLELSIVFCTNDEIRQINRDYRAKDRETDVITFALFADDDNAFVIDDSIDLGEIIIAPDVARAQAKYGFDIEIKTLICHGILHLLGFDHMTEEDYNFIVKTQDEVIKELGC